MFKYIQLPNLKGDKKIICINKTVNKINEHILSKTTQYTQNTQGLQKENQNRQIC